MAPSAAELLGSHPAVPALCGAAFEGPEAAGTQNIYGREVRLQLPATRFTKQCSGRGSSCDSEVYCCRLVAYDWTALDSA